MVEIITNSKKLNLKEKPVISELMSTLFELGFGLVVVLNSVFLSHNIVFQIIIPLVFFTVFSAISLFYRSLTGNLIRRAVSVVLSYIILLFAIPSQTWPVFVVFVLFVFGNSILGIRKSMREGNENYVNIRVADLIIFALVAFFIILLFLLNNLDYFTSWSNNRTLFGILNLMAVAIIISITASIINNFKDKALRNIVFPFITAVLLFLSFTKGNNSITGNLKIAFGASILISVISYKLKFLTFEGSKYQFLLALLILGLGGWKWTVPILVFFITSSLLSKVKSRSKNKAELFFEKSGTRDSNQVLANGGLGGLFVVLNVLFPSELFYLAYVSSLAVVCSDTWGTEIGTYFNTKTISIKNFKETEQGTSGGISIYGSIGALLGAFIIPISSLFWLNSILLISICGFLGNIVDSFLGAVAQVQYKCNVCGKLTERKYHCKSRPTLIKGMEWLNNDAVNFISALTGAVFLVILKEIINA